MKRLLYISYYFPPSGGPGVQRPLKVVKHLLSFDWQATVLTIRLEDAAYPDLDPSLLQDIPDEVDVLRTKGWDPYAVYASLLGKSKTETVGVGFINDAGQTRVQRLGRWFRANFFLPDARVGWVPFALHTAKNLISNGGFDAVVTTGPPHSTHLIGLRLKRQFGVPWLADFRDPWTDISYYGELPITKPARRLDAAMERSVLSQADAVVSVSDGCGKLLKARASVRRYKTIFNGFDTLIVDKPVRTSTSAGRFIIGHIGTLSAAQHVPGLIEALAQRIVQEKAWANRLKLLLVGNVDETIMEAFRHAGLIEYVERVAYVPHNKALDYMRQTDVLFVSVQRTEKTEGVLTGKIFEYLSAGVPVLGFASPYGDLAAILEETQGGVVFQHDDVSGIGRYLDERFDRAGKGLTPDEPNRMALQQYDRREQTRKFAELLDEICETPKSR